MDESPCHPHVKNNNWKHADAAAMLCKLTDDLGTPDVYDGVQSGIAIWRGRKVQNPHCAHEITLKDESVLHRCPAKHNDFLYTTLKAEIPADKVDEVTKLSGSISYDPLNTSLTARCGSLEANVATLNLATQIAVGKMDIDAIQKEGTYGKTIKSISCDSQADEACSNHLDTLRKELCDNVKQLKPRGLDYYENAFNDSCDAPDHAST
jgi:hypothetical protein